MCSFRFTSRASRALRVSSPGVPLRMYASVAEDATLRSRALARSSCLVDNSSNRARTLPPTPHVMTDGGNVYSTIMYAFPLGAVCVCVYVCTVQVRSFLFV